MKLEAVKELRQQAIRVAAVGSIAFGAMALGVTRAEALTTGEMQVSNTPASETTSSTVYVPQVSRIAETLDPRVSLESPQMTFYCEKRDANGNVVDRVIISPRDLRAYRDYDCTPVPPNRQ